MADERSDTPEETSEAAYEAPAVEALGSDAEATAGDQDFSVVDNDDSDSQLKYGVQPVGHALERLRTIRTR